MTPFGIIIPGQPATKKNSGRIVRTGKFSRILPSAAYMKNQNMSWREIGETLGLKSPASYFCKLKNKYGGGMNENY